MSFNFLFNFKFVSLIKPHSAGIMEYTDVYLVIIDGSESEDSAFVWPGLLTISLGYHKPRESRVMVIMSHVLWLS